MKHSEEHKKKISESMKGRIISAEHRENLSKALIGNKNCLGRKHTEETKAKIRKTEIGKNVSTETKEKQRKAKIENPVRYWLGKNRLESTKLKIKESLVGRFRGSESPSWRGGKSPYSQHWTEDLKDSIRKRDNYTCQLCGVKQDELKTKLDVHHIDYDKMNYDPTMLISLCHSCHARTNHNREQWMEKWITQLL